MSTLCVGGRRRSLLISSMFYRYRYPNTQTAWRTICGHFFERLQYYRRNKPGKQVEYLNNSSEAKWFCLARVGDYMALCGRPCVDQCPVCEQQVSCIWNHILTQCHAIDLKRRQILERKGKPGGLPSTLEWSCEILKNENYSVVKIIGGLLREWVVERIRCERINKEDESTTQVTNSN
jgi:hypothetical protein